MATLSVNASVIPASRGGRRTAVRTGYHAHLAIPSPTRTLHGDATLTWVAADSVEPGEESRARLSPVDPSIWGSVKPGTRLKALEGDQVVMILEVVSVDD
jgi:hypothetical protein